MATKKAPPRRNTDVIRCENCGEEYSTTYKRCPFCDERPGGRSYPPVGGRRVAGGSRSGRGGQPNPLQVAGLVISLVLIIAAVVIVFTTLSPLLFGSTPSGSNSGGASVSTSTGNVTLESLTLSRTDEDQVALQAVQEGQTAALVDKEMALGATGALTVFFGLLFALRPRELVYFVALWLAVFLVYSLLMINVVL